MASASEEALPSYRAACADTPPSYKAYNHDYEPCEDQISRDISSLPYSRLDFAERDVAATAPDIYLDSKTVSTVVGDNAEDMFVKSDGRTYCYSL